LLYKTCCGGVLNPGRSKSCCGQKAYNIRYKTCCGGVLNPGRSKSCCGQKAYNIRYKTCCGRVLNHHLPPQNAEW
jgi:hypothetical protein